MNHVHSSPTTILVVEDSADMLELIELALVRRGNLLLQSSSVEEALETWETHGEQIDLLVTDLRLGVSGSGWDLAEQLLARKPTLKVLVISGFFEPSHCLEANVEFLKKPFKFTDLASRVEALLRQQETVAS